MKGRLVALLMSAFVAGCVGDDKDRAVVEGDGRDHSSYRSITLEATPERRPLGVDPTLYCFVRVNGEPMAMLLRAEDQFYALSGSGPFDFIGRRAVWQGKYRTIRNRKGDVAFDLALRRQALESAGLCH